MKRNVLLLLLLLLTQTVWPATKTVTPELPDPGRVGMSPDQQEKLGLQAAAEVYKQMPVLPDSSPVTQYIQQLGRKLVTVIPPEHTWPYQFHVIQQKEINAFALPGGPIFINVGTITAADNEAELAGVMAHEMSHVYMQHSAKQAPKQEWANILGALGGLLGGGAGALAQMGIQLGAGTLLMKYSRKDEAQADAVGAIVMYKAGYDPKAMAEFFQKLEQQGGGNGPQFLSDHPNPGNRVKAVEEEIANWPPKNYLTTSPGFVQAKQQAASVKAYTAQQISDGAKQGIWAQQNAKAGAVAPNAPAASDQPPAQTATGAITNVSYSEIRPSDTFQTFQQEAFSISYPANWQVATGQNSVTIAPQAGLTQNAIGYGVEISLSPVSSQTDIDQETADLVRNLQQSNPGLRIFDSQRALQVAGAQGRSVMLAGNSPVQENGRPLPERDWLVTLSRPGGGLLYLVFIAPERDFQKLQPIYQKMLNSLQLR